MKKLLIYLIILSMTILFTDCDYLTVCDAKRYQVKVKNDLGKGMCYFRLQADGDCLVWANRQHLEFVDSCKAYGISQMVWRDDIKKKYGI